MDEPEKIEQHITALEMISSTANEIVLI